jgi:ABC-type sugar transport system permease subunit
MKQLKIKQKRSLAGWLFILPWFFGLLIFFIQPMVSFVVYSFTNFRFADNGGYVLEALSDGKLANYVKALSADAKYPILIFESFKNLLYQTPIIVFFSLFVAIILNQKFKGRLVMRTVFFLPIIISSGVISTVIKQDLNTIAMTSASESYNLFNVSGLVKLLLESGFPDQIVTVLTTMIANVGDLVWKSSIQILIFIAALLSIPQSYYEAAQVEGATGWETFWKITLPIVSPFVLANTVYTIIDSFTTNGNGVIDYITEYSVKDMNYSYAAAMSWIYFLLILVVLTAVMMASRRMVFYGNKR